MTFEEYILMYLTERAFTDVQALEVKNHIMKQLPTDKMSKFSCQDMSCIDGFVKLQIDLLLIGYVVLFVNTFYPESSMLDEFLTELERLKLQCQ